MSTLFSSPSKTASAAADKQLGISNEQVGAYEQYVANQEGQLRNAISGLPSNPFYNAAQTMSTTPYQVDPSKSQVFGAPTTVPGITQGTPTAQGNPFAPPAGPPRVAAPPPGGPPTQVGTPVPPPTMRIPMAQRPPTPGTYGGVPTRGQA